MTWSLRTRLTLSFVLVALACILMVSALANGILESSFRRYVRDNQVRQARQVVSQIGAQRTAAGAWDQDAISAIGMGALEQGMIVKVSDLQGRMVWDATQHNNGLCVQMIDHMARNMASRYPRWQGAYTETAFPLRASFSSVGTVTIGYYGPFYLDDQELSFINSLNILLLWVTVAATGLAVLIGYLSARRITVPLARVAQATLVLARGGRDVVIPARTRVRELDGIASAVNDLSRSLRDQEDLRRRLTADMAHELRTPLATVQGHLEAMMDGVWQPDADRLAGLHEEVLRISRLVAGLEQLARLEGGAAGIDRKETDLRLLLEGILRNHEAQFRDKGVALKLLWEGGTPGRPVLVDPDRLSQAVINLLANALQYTPAGGVVDVGGRVSADGADIRVSDTGPGIDAKDLPRVFERLYRADGSRSRSTGGAGIGLSIVKAIVEAHGGTVRAESEPGRGTRFVISLPLGTAPRTG